MALSACTPAGPSKPAVKSSPIVVENKRLTFEPKTCTEGRAGLSWEFGTLSVTVLGQHDGFCEFDYQYEVESAGKGYHIYRVSVPIDSGPVVIDPRRGQTSFSEKQMKLIRTAWDGWFTDPLEGTKESVTHRPIRPGGMGTPLKKHDKLTVRFLVYLDLYKCEFNNLAGEQWQRQSAVIPVTGDTEWKWAQHVLQEMKLYEIRQGKVPASVAGPAIHWLPGYTEKSQVYVEMQAVRIERR